MRLSAERVFFSLILMGGVNAAGSPASAQQPPDAAALAAKASIVVRGAVMRSEASDEPLLAPSAKTAVISIRTMYAGGEFVGDLAGQTATVILAGDGKPQRGNEMLFFGNPRYAGKGLTIADIGEIPLTVRVADEAALARGVQVRRDGPIRARLAIAAAVFRGRVEKISGFEKAAAQGRSGPDGEHDPEFRVAWIRVGDVGLGAKTGAVVPVVFPSSRDIIWFKVPKLKPGVEAIIIGHLPLDGEQVLLRNTGAAAFIKKTRAVLATDIFDILAVSQEKRVFDLLRTKEPAQ